MQKYKNLPIFAKNTYTMDDFDRDSRASDWFHDDNEYADYDIADIEGYYPGRKTTSSHRSSTSRRYSTPNTPSSSGGSSYYVPYRQDGVDCEGGEPFYLEFARDPLSLKTKTAPMAKFSIFRMPANIVVTIINIILISIRDLWRDDFVFFPFFMLWFLAFVLGGIRSDSTVIQESKNDYYSIFSHHITYQITFGLFCLINMGLLYIAFFHIYEHEFLGGITVFLYAFGALWNVFYIIELFNNRKKIEVLKKDAKQELKEGIEKYESLVKSGKSQGRALSLMRKQRNWELEILYYKTYIPVATLKDYENDRKKVTEEDLNMICWAYLS